MMSELTVCVDYEPTANTQQTDDEEETDNKILNESQSNVNDSLKKKKKKKKKQVETILPVIKNASSNELAEAVEKVKINQNDNEDEDDDAATTGASGSDSKIKKKKKNKNKKESSNVLNSTVKTQTNPPSIPICDLFPDGNFPLGQILDHPVPKNIDE